jgi:hypothetical protein
MLRRSSATLFGLAVAFGLGLLFSNRPAFVEAQPPAVKPLLKHGKCVGVAAAQLATGNISTYRAFEDGTVEVSLSGPDRQWQEIGK